MDLRPANRPGQMVSTTCWGLRMERDAPTCRRLTCFIHPDDRQRVANDVESAIKKGGDYYGEFRVIRGDGAVVWLSSKGRRIRDAFAPSASSASTSTLPSASEPSRLLASDGRLRSAFDHADDRYGAGCQRWPLPPGESTVLPCSAIPNKNCLPPIFRHSLTRKTWTPTGPTDASF